MFSRLRPALIASLALLSIAGSLTAEDWPEWRGAGRGGVWTETGIVDAFPAEGLTFDWRTPIRNGYSGPSVADGKVFITDFEAVEGLKGTERALCLDERTGEILWMHEYDADYKGLSYNYGPRATPTVDGDRVYTLGSMGALRCLSVADGSVLWQKDYIADYQTQVPMWGMTGAPLIDGDLAICLVGGADGGKVMAFDKHSGTEVWRALSSDWSAGYAQPILIEAAQTPQLIIWEPQNIVSLNPQTGETHWKVPFEVRSALTVATPVREGNRLFVTAFYNGPMMLRLSEDAPGAEMVWRGSSSSERVTDKLHALVTTPVLDGDHVYGVGSYGRLRCLDIETGERVWESVEPVGEVARWATAFLVRHEDRYFINNDAGDLIIAELSPDGYHEISRTKLIEPTTRGAGRRNLKLVNWSHPAYANRHIIARNDNEIVRASLAK